MILASLDNLTTIYLTLLIFKGENNFPSLGLREHLPINITGTFKAVHNRLV